LVDGAARHHPVELLAVEDLGIGQADGMRLG